MNICAYIIEISYQLSFSLENLLFLFVALFQDEIGCTELLQFQLENLLVF
jgi:hypothetical protein